MLRPILVSAALVLMTTSCLDTSGEDADAGDTQGGTDDAVPVEAADLTEWLAAGNYANWAAESGLHGSTGPHGVVRTFFNEQLAASFDAGNATHPTGSAAVKELYDDMDVAIGWAVMVKVAEGEDASSWYWYLESSGSVTADGEGIPTCENCHVSGTDRVLTPYPLQ